MAKQITDNDLRLLDELGVDTTPKQSGGLSAREQRIIAGFEEICLFAREHGRAPEHGPDGDIFERIYAVRLDRIRELADCRELLKDYDSLGLLDHRENTEQVLEDLSDQELLESLGVGNGVANELTQLVHVRSHEEIKAAEQIAQRSPCEDFAVFKTVFEEIQGGLASGYWETIKYQDNAEIRKGDVFILDGQMTLVAEVGERFITSYDKPDHRLRVVYDNGTESDLLLRSLQRALNKDKASRRVMAVAQAAWFDVEDETEEHGGLQTGYVYVLRSNSKNEFVVNNRQVIHKIGVTGGDVEKRIAGASRDATYLLADVEIVATFELTNINRRKLEALLHKFFANARLNLEIPDRFGIPVKAREWFLVPFGVIEETIEKIKTGEIQNYYYHQESARLLPVQHK